MIHCIDCDCRADYMVWDRGRWRPVCRRCFWAFERVQHAKLGTVEQPLRADWCENANKRGLSPVTLAESLSLESFEAEAFDDRMKGMKG